MMSAECLEAGMMSGQGMIEMEMDEDIRRVDEVGDNEVLETTATNSNFETALVLSEDEGSDDDDEVSLEKKGESEKKPRKKKSKSAKVGVQYPTQYMMVGEINCIFFSCYYKGRSPLLTLGPSWPFTFVLLMLAIMIGGFFELLLWESGDKPHFLHKLWCQGCVILNLTLLLTGILKNPGIPQSLIDRLLKE